VLSIYQLDKEHLIISVPVPKGKFDYIANLSAVGKNNYSLNQSSLGVAIRKKFGLEVRREHIETNVLLLTVRSSNAPGLKLNSDPFQWGPQLTKKSFSCHGGIWKLVQSLEDYFGTIVVDRTGLTGHYDINVKWDSAPTREVLKRALRDQLGLELVPSDDPVAIPMFVAEKATKPPVQTLSQLADIQPDGTVRFQITIKQTNRTGGTLLTDYIDGMDGPNVDWMTDELGQPMKFATQRDGNGSVLIVTLNKPVSSESQFSYTVELTATNLCQLTGEPGGFECQLHDYLSDECITHSIEEYRLPLGAVLLSKQPADLKETTNDGRIELRIDRMIPPEGVRKTDFRYRLPANASRNARGRKAKIICLIIPLDGHILIECAT
jgi:uncharacterized protein (TIGR03435 family)